MNSEWRHYKPGCFRVHHEAADRHTCLQFLGSVLVHVSWTSQMTLRFNTDFWWKGFKLAGPHFIHSGCPFFVNASHGKGSTTCLGGHGDGLGEWAASVNNWQTWASSRCGTSAWEADARPTCPCAIQWQNLCRSVVFWNWRGSICPQPCLVFVIGLFSVTCQWHMAYISFRVVFCLFDTTGCLRCCQSPAEPSMWTETWTSRSLFAACWHAGVCLCKCPGQLWYPEQGPRASANVWSICPRSDAGLRPQLSQCLQMSEWIASHVSDLLSLIWFKFLIWQMFHCHTFSIVPNKYDPYYYSRFCVQEVW